MFRENNLLSVKLVVCGLVICIMSSYERWKANFN